MIVTEYFDTREDGVVLERTSSDAGYMIRQDDTGALYSEAIDPRAEGRTYTETDLPIEDESEVAEE